jgi:hypothetical protein
MGNKTEFCYFRNFVAFFWRQSRKMEFVVNKASQLRAVRRAGGGHKVAEHTLQRLPWAGIFEPWRSHVLLAAAAQKLCGSAANRPQVKRRGPSAKQLQLVPAARSSRCIAVQRHCTLNGAYAEVDVYITSRAAHACGGKEMLARPQPRDGAGKTVRQLSRQARKNLTPI